MQAGDAGLWQRSYLACARIWVESSGLKRGRKNRKEEKEGGREQKKIFSVWVMTTEASRLFPCFLPTHSGHLARLGVGGRWFGAWIGGCVCRHLSTLSLLSFVFGIGFFPGTGFLKPKSLHSSVLLCVWALSRWLHTELLNKALISPPCRRGFASSIHCWLFSWHWEEGFVNGRHDFLLNFSQTVWLSSSF